jgi:hypothetical protein
MQPDAITLDLLPRLFDSGRKLVYEFTGAGSLALSWLHSVGGSSRLLLEACDRYSPGSLAELLGHAPAKAVSADVASRWRTGRTAGRCGWQTRATGRAWGWRVPRRSPPTARNAASTRATSAVQDRLGRTTTPS